MSKFLVSSTRSQWLILMIAALTSSTQLGARGEPHPWADNVCNKSVAVMKDFVIEKPVEYEIRVQSMCGILPCTKTRIETRQDQTIKTIKLFEQRAACCDGYVETPSRQCAPICLDSCYSGKCVAPNVCECQPAPSEGAPGFVGPTCKRFTCLERQKWGAKCERDCPTNCSQNSYCSADTGKCLCFPGWHGSDCSLECDANSDADDCQESNKLPAFVEPDVNLLSSSEILLPRAQRPQALTLMNDKSDEDGAVSKIATASASNGQPWASFASSYLIGILGLMSLVFLAAFLIVKRRYELVRNELYYASAASAISDRSRSPGSGSEYSGGSPSYYSTSGTRSATSDGSGNLEKNLSFSTATRNILTGVVGAGTGGNGKLLARPSNQDSNKLQLLIAPRIESHLIRSQKQAEQNVYSQLDSTTTSIANRSRAQTPERQLRPRDDDDDNGDDNHIYSVPKTSPVVVAVFNQTSKQSHDTSVEMGAYEDSLDSNIYEEIKPRVMASDKQQHHQP